ncbi:YqaA family protein [Terriglobus roseus]|uniref:Membrane protein YqaA, SNARE-associated domain n=1 Tax=Terriglobus roseus TaxID=392734 RepID=A0A1G7P4Q8_9BACT|nr:VTT domain-containing protein [Terriglobus roseus]SDF81306.1 membrane protein YqaA, SNARE-associated domain [Terriglobus roseus]
MFHLHALATLLQTAQTAVPPAAPHHVGWLKHFTQTTQAFFERFGLWGLAAIALLDSAMLPMPWQYLLISDVNNHASTWLVYPLVAALASSVGSLVPFYVGRVGGEIFLLGKINRERYERLRDRFERQEFLAIFIPAIGPPPTPFKLFEFCAGVFEMKPAVFLLAAFLGKLIQYGAYAFLTHKYGPQVMDVVMHGVHTHAQLTRMVVGVLLVLVVVWVLRKVFDRRKGTQLPIEDGVEDGKTVIVEE